MIEIWLFGWLVATLGSAASVVLLIVALTSVTYLATTLVPALRDAAGAGGDRGGRFAGIAAALSAFAIAIAGLRVGSPGSMGEMIPTLAVTVAAAAAIGSTAALAWIGSARAFLALGAARAGRARRLEGARDAETQRVEAGRRAYLEGDDLRAEVDEADAAVLRLRTAIERLDRARANLAEKLLALDEEAAAGDLGRELRHARDDLATKLELGGKILGAAEAAAFRIACGAPVKRLLRRRPRDVTKDLGGQAARIDPAAGALRAFLGDAETARRSLSALEPRRDGGDPGDPWAQATRDVEAVTRAYAAVLERLEVVRVRLAARAEMDAVASAAGEVSDRARASGLDAADLSDLVGEVTRAESAIAMATPGDLDTHALTDALARSTIALDRSDGASIDELLRAMRELA